MFVTALDAVHSGHPQVNQRVSPAVLAVVRVSTSLPRKEMTSMTTKSTNADSGKKKRDAIASFDPDLKIYPEFDDCIVGIAEGFNVATSVVYDLPAIINQLVDTSDMSYEDAWEHYTYNIRGGYIGEDTPIFITKTEDL